MDTEYHLFLCDTYGEHEPVAVFISKTPFPSVQVGQRFDDHGWNRLRGVGVIASEEKPIRYIVHSTKTVVQEVGGKLLVQVGYNLKPFESDRSPVFGNTQPTMSWSEALNNSDV